MNPRALLLGILVAAVVIALLVWLTAWWIRRSAGIRRADYKLMRQERELACRALWDIEDKAVVYSDIESVLATEIRTIIRLYNQDRMELNR